MRELATQSTIPPPLCEADLRRAIQWLHRSGLLETATSNSSYVQKYRGKHDYKKRLERRRGTLDGILLQHDI